MGTELNYRPQRSRLEAQRPPRNEAKKQHPCRVGVSGSQKGHWPGAHPEGDAATEKVN